MPTEPRWYMDKMRNEANAETAFELPERFMGFEEAENWCSICAGPIFAGMRSLILEGYPVEVTDRHGETFTIQMPRQAVHEFCEKNGFAIFE